MGWCVQPNQSTQRHCCYGLDSQVSWSGVWFVSLYNITTTMKSMLRFFILSFFAFVVMLTAHGQVVINEGSNRNYTTIADENGDFPDWIELYNAGTDTVNLNNYSLTDDPALPSKWTLPALRLAPGGFKTVFCSGKDRAPLSGFINVATLNAFTPVVGWNTHTLSTPFYWDGVSNILISTCSFSNTGYTSNSIFNQSSTPFLSTLFAYQDGSNAACAANIGTAVAQRPNMQFNGVAVGSGVQQNTGTDYPAPYGNWYWGAKNQMLVLASELYAAGVNPGNITSLAFDVAATDPNTIYTSLDIYMRATDITNLGSDFSPVDPSNNFHTNFTIAQNGETIHLYSPTQVDLSALLVNNTALNVSRGSLPDASSTIKLFNTPSPGASNNTSIGYDSYLLAPSISTASGFYQNPISVSITNINPATPASSIHYTLDGSDPSLSSPVYSGNPIPIFYSLVLKASAISNGAIASPISTCTYFFGVNHVTPILSVITPDTNLYGASGIFDNWSQDWQRAAYVEYFDTLHNRIFSRYAGMQIDGGWGGSRSQPQHSFRIEFDNNVLGSGAVNYPLIPNRAERSKYSSIYLRNGSNQYLQIPYKEAAQEEMMCAETHTYYSAWRPITVYINGRYFGLYELREKFDQDYFKQQDNASTASTEIFSVSAWYGWALRAVVGSIDTFYTAYNQFDQLNPSSSMYWDQADHYFDLTYYADYIISESYMANTDWPANNIKFYRSDKTNNRYRFCTIDLENGMLPNGWTDCTTDHIDYILNQSSANPFINIFLQSIQNNQFKDYFINRYADLMNTSYRTERITGIEDAMFNQTVTEMQNEYARWGDPANVPAQMNTFYNNHLVFNEQLACRSTNVRTHLRNHFNLPNLVDLTLDVIPAGAGKIHISTIEPTDYPWNGIYFNGVPVKIEAIAAPGYHFSHWDPNALISNTADSIFIDTLDVSTIDFTAYFEGNPLGVDDDNAAAAALRLYPNPVHNILEVSVTDPTANPKAYALMDMLGNRVLEGSLGSNSKHFYITTSALPAGSYVLRLHDADGRMSNRVFIKLED